MTRMSDLAIARCAFGAGFRGQGLIIAVAVALAESGGDPLNSNTVGNSHGKDRGLWQINDYYHPEVSDAVAYDPNGCAHAAYQISSGGKDWSPWCTYTDGAYEKFMPRATSVVASLRTGAPVMATLRRGDTGPAVRRLQVAVGAACDGIFGPATEARVKVFQREHGLTADGVVGPLTQHALGWR